MNTIVVRVPELLETLSTMQESGMEYAFLDIEAEPGKKVLYISGVEGLNSAHDIEFGCLDGVPEMEQD